MITEGKNIILISFQRNIFGFTNIKGFNGNRLSQEKTIYQIDKRSGYLIKKFCEITDQFTGRQFRSFARYKYDRWGNPNYYYYIEELFSVNPKSLRIELEYESKDVLRTYEASDGNEWKKEWGIPFPFENSRKNFCRQLEYAYNNIRGESKFINYPSLYPEYFNTWSNEIQIQ
jgi:hypothetical protein